MVASIRRAAFLSVLYLSGYAGIAGAQIITYTGFRFSPYSSYESQEPLDALDLVPTHGGPTGRVWFQQGEDGIIVHGKVKGDYPKWPEIPLEMETHTHVDLWISGTDSVAMPDIGWGNQFGTTTCEEFTKNSPGSEGTAKDCKVWKSRQVTYRDQLRKLFVRRWQLAPGVSKEGFATTGYSAVLEYTNDKERGVFTKLNPARIPYLVSMNSTGYWRFEIFVRWSDLPPFADLKISRLFAAVEVFDGTGKFSSTAPKREQGDPSTFNRFRFERTIEHKIGPCSYPLTDTDPYGKEMPAWYFPADGASVSDTFILNNEAAGYRYEPEGLSPIPAWTHYFSKDLGEGKFICGPPLRFNANGKVAESKYLVDEDHLSFVKNPDGSFLIKSGPILGSYSKFGSGQCGACATMRISVFRMAVDGSIARAFDSTVNLEQPFLAGFDIQLSPDWKTITIYRNKEDSPETVWTFERYCLKDDKYEECGSGPSKAPPEPHQFIWKPD
jgi:hypothetical protein